MEDDNWFDYVPKGAKLGSFFYRVDGFSGMGHYGEEEDW